jgi:DNA repair protein RadD
MNDFVFRYYQVNAINAWFDYWANGGRGNPLVGMPTGTGKSAVICKIAHLLLTGWSGTRVLMLTHVWKLVEQNARTMLNGNGNVPPVWPNCPLGIHSAELGQRDTMQPVIFGNIQSAYKTVEKLGAKESFGWIDHVLVDEAHLVSDKEDAQYRKLISALQQINPNLRVSGFSATLYRLKLGTLTDNGIFTDVIYNDTSYSRFNQLVAEGFLAPLIGKPTATRYNLAGVSIQAGEYNQKQLEQAVDHGEINYKVCTEICQYAMNRRSWMIFSAGIDHSEHLSAILNSFGIPSGTVHSKNSAKDNRDRLAAYENSELRCVVGNNMLTTGYDYRPLDFIADCQPTCSPGKHVQKLGRGTRISPETGKENCLLLDFAGNVQRNGPINDPIMPRKPGEKVGDAPIRICDDCGAYNHASARFCVNCGCEFIFSPKIFQEARNVEPMRIDAPEISIIDVHRVFYSMHEKAGSAPSLRVGYACGTRRFDEWIHFEHPTAFLRHKAHTWWKARHLSEPPNFTFEALRQQAELRQPKRIKVHLNKQPFPEIMGYEF